MPTIKVKSHKRVRKNGVTVVRQHVKKAKTVKKKSPVKKAPAKSPVTKKGNWLTHGKGENMYHKTKKDAMKHVKKKTNKHSEVWKRKGARFLTVHRN